MSHPEYQIPESVPEATHESTHESGAESARESQSPGPIAARRYLQSVRIQNFQGHRDTTMEFGPNVNLITGSSDSGKSASLRALNWVLHNKPNGIAFIRKNQTEACVTVTFSDGWIVSRVRSEKDNAYHWWTPDGVEHRRDKIAGTVPDEVRAILGNPPIDSSHGPVSYSSQSAPAFLVSLTPQKLPQAISELTGIQELEDAAKLLGSKALSATKEVNKSTERVKALRISLDAFAGINDEIAQVAVLRERAEDVKTRLRQCEQATLTLERYQEVNETGSAANAEMKRAQRIVALDSELSVGLLASSRLKAARSLIFQESVLEEDGRNSEQRVKALSRITDMTLETGLISLRDNLNRLKSSTPLIRQAVQLERDEVDNEQEVAHACTRVVQAEEALGVHVVNMKACGQWCDVCDAPARNLISKEVK